MVNWKWLTDTGVIDFGSADDAAEGRRCCKNMKINKYIVFCALLQRKVETRKK